MPSGPAVESSRQAYSWPDAPLRGFGPSTAGSLFRSAPLHESPADLAADSRWPVFFPSPICLITAGHDGATVLERVVGPMIVNRFPLVMAISVCREPLSPRHYARRTTLAAIEQSGQMAVQFLAPGAALSHALEAIAAEPDERATRCIARAGAATRPLPLTGTPALDAAYLVYEGRLAEPTTTAEGAPALSSPWIDVGSHRIYFVEVLAIYLEATVARGERQIVWRSLPSWTPQANVPPPPYDAQGLAAQRYVKTYTPNYRFPAEGTVAFEPDDTFGHLAVRHLEQLPGGQVVVDNERARWPCFFPSSAGMLTAWRDDDRPTAMPCGSTGIVSRFPLTVATCISNSAINERYAPRATLGTVRARGRFGVGVPFVDDAVVRAVSYLGNISARVDPDKVAHAGLTVLAGDGSPLLAELPVHLECRVAGEVTLGTHVMVLGEVDRIHVRHDVHDGNPLRWSPWAAVE